MLIEIRSRSEDTKTQSRDTPNHEITAIRAHKTQREVGLSAGEVYERVARGQLHTQAGTFAEEGWESWGDELARDQVRRRDPNHTPRASVEPLDRVDELSGGNLEELSTRNDLLGCRSRDEPFGHPVEEANAEVALESRNPSADRALIDTEARTRCRAASLTESGKEYPEIVPALHLPIIA